MKIIRTLGFLALGLAAFPASAVETLSVTGTSPQSVQFGFPQGTTDASQIGRSNITAAYKANGPGNSWGFLSQLMIEPHAANGPWQKSAIYGHAVTQKANTPGNNFVDAHGGLFQAWINGGNSSGRAWGAVLEASLGEDSNGLLFSTELGLYFPASKEEPNHRDEAFSKSNVWLAAGSPGRASAGIKFGNIHDPELKARGGWFTGIAIQHTVQKAMALDNPVLGSAGIIFDNNQGWAEALRIPNGAPITSYKHDGSGVVGLFFMSQFDQLVIGQGSNGVVLFIDGAPHAVEMGPPDASGYRTLRVRN